MTVRHPSNKGRFSLATKVLESGTTDCVLEFDALEGGRLGLSCVVGGGKKL